MDSQHCNGLDPAFPTYSATKQQFRCISASEGVLTSAPINTTAYNMFFCNRYKVSADSTQVFVAAAAQMGTFPQCPDSVVFMADLESAPAFVTSAGIFNVIGSTQLPQCSS